MSEDTTPKLPYGYYFRVIETKDFYFNTKMPLVCVMKKRRRFLFDKYVCGTRATWWSTDSIRSAMETARNLLEDKLRKQKLIGKYPPKTL